MNFYVKKRDVLELIEYTELERDKNMLRYLYKDSDELLHIFTTKEEKLGFNYHLCRKTSPFRAGI